MKMNIIKSTGIAVSIAVLLILNSSALMAEGKHTDGILSASDAMLITKGPIEKEAKAAVTKDYERTGVINQADFEFVSKPYAKPDNSGKFTKAEKNYGVLSSADLKLTK